MAEPVAAVAELLAAASVGGGAGGGGGDADAAAGAEAAVDAAAELLECARYGELEEVVALVAAGADVNAADEAGSTALHNGARPARACA